MRMGWRLMGRGDIVVLASDIGTVTYEGEGFEVLTETYYSFEYASKLLASIKTRVEEDVRRGRSVDFDNYNL